VEAAAGRAARWIREQRKRRVGIIVNRVQTAGEIAERLRAEMKPGEADVVLLTGRLRPLERDALTEQWKPFLKANNPDNSARPILFVSTQAIEVGADFSFDALVTECASIDALRQRFGRLNRMGLPGEAPAAILVREDDLKQDVSDPIYGEALRNTWAFLLERTKIENDEKHPRRILDFGFAALHSLLSEVDDEKIAQCLAPRPDAPVLLPAHLDLLSQTAPTPHPEPDISRFLHGKDRGVPEVRVLWRADLDPDITALWVETIALCPPQSTESVSVPLYRLRRSPSEQSPTQRVTWKGKRNRHLRPNLSTIASVHVFHGVAQIVLQSPPLQTRFSRETWSYFQLLTD
jgi:CRISPR-associated endonuclease/helicase Cas3